MADDNKTPVDQLLDLFVYAPLGLALTARDQLPSLIERGRAQVNQQTTLAKMMGQYAVKEGEKEIRRRVEQMSARPEPEPAPAPPPPSPATATNGKAAAPAAPAGPATPAEAKPTGDHLAIPGYDTLSASQVVQRLPGLSNDELAAVRAYEEATRGRRTILTKIGQLQAESS
jgi:hypothetical protein